MNVQEIKRRRVSLEQGKQMVATCQASEIPAKEWCEENHVKRKKYYYWLSK